MIKSPGAHPGYVVELEPHLLVAPFHENDLGFGFRGTIEIVDNGFLSKVNNTVGIGFGVDATNHDTWVPIVMQWNFWLSRKWSVFGEPGVAFRDGDHFQPFVMYGGGRFLFSDTIALTLRAGHPTLSVGISILL